MTNVRTASGIWDLGHLHELSPELREDLRLAELFSLGMEGAALLYNLMLAEKAVSEGLAFYSERVDYYRSRMERWADAMLGFSESLPADIVDSLQIRIFRLNPRIHRGAIDFSTSWLAAALIDPRPLAVDQTMRQMIRRREHRLKGSLARLSNRRALENWSGASGLGRLTFRWPNARRIILDIHAGLRSVEEVA